MGADANNMVIEYDCGIKYARLAAWASDTEKFGCTVTLTQKPDRTLSRSVSLPVTAIRIEGPQKSVEQLYREFELTFLSAGG